LLFSYTLPTTGRVRDFHPLDCAHAGRTGIRLGRVIPAATLAELAKKLAVPAAALEETVQKHNAYIASGQDPEFHKPISKNMVPLEQGAFYAIPQWPSVHHCMGGLRINTAAQVIDIWGQPIPRLYAAGEVCGGLHGSNRLGGNAIPDCIVFGRLAGQAAGRSC
jgi:fumarate reductase flavoprotein subunit